MPARTKTSRRRDPECKPSLRISHIVHGRKSDGNRVKYRIDHEKDKYDIPEKVVLIRWRKRKHENYVFSGSRLGPHVWRALALLLGSDCHHWSGRLNKEFLDASHREHQDLIVARRFRDSIPDLGTIQAIHAICGPERLQKLVDRHADGKIFGVPDLFLFASDKRTGEKFMGRFVEVKKPEEPASDGQREEIAFMNEIGLHARLLRLIEREKTP